MSPLVPNIVDAAALADELTRYRVVGPDRLSDLLAFPGGSAVALAEFLIRGGAVTPFQAERALTGEARMLALGPYRLTGTHRVGPLGPVFRAEPAHGSRGSVPPPAPRAGAPAADRVFAVRAFPLRSLWRAKQAQQLARALSALPPHPSVVPLVAAGSANGYHYLAWPLAEGPTLAEKVAADGPLAPERVAAVVTHLLDGLVTCHARTVVHGAITPQAVVLPPVGPARLLDLGVGTILADDLSTGESLLDTITAALAAAEALDFAAPELIANPTNPTEAADQYAAAAVGYFALTGRPPFAGDTLTDRLMAREAGAPPPVTSLNPAVPPALAAVLHRMLSPDPADRFALLEDARVELVAVSGERLPLVAQPPVSLGLGASSSGRSRSGAGSRDGTVSWGSSGIGAAPPSRDDTESSITFDIPEHFAPPPPDTPRSALSETKPPAALPAVPPAPTPAPAPTPLPPPPAPPTPPPRKADPRLTMPTPVQYHTADAESSGGAAPPKPDDQSPVGSVLWKRLRRKVLFWKAPTDPVQVSVFGPVGLAPGQSARVCVVLHAPEAAESVRTLTRAFERDAELLGTAPLVHEVARESVVAVHLTVTNAGVNRSLVAVEWRGQPHRLVFDLHVPWESPGGPAPGLVSVGQGDVRIGKVEFHLQILPRKG